jgi:Immunity protein 50
MSDGVCEHNTAHVRNRELLIKIFGGWPSFHDAEVLRVELDRDGQQLLAVIYLFRMTDKVDSSGYYVLENKVLATLRFLGVVDLTLKWFNQQNVLWNLEIIDVRERQLEHISFEVSFPSSFGLEADFKCESIEVVSVEPYANGTQGLQSPPKSDPRSSA